jgi:hypothetical protein
MTRLRRHKFLAALIGCLALAANLVALTSTCVHGVKPVAASVVDAVLGPLTICTSDGAVVGAGSDGKQHSSPGGHCQSCILLAAASLLVAAAMLALGPFVVALRLLRAAAATLLAFLLGPGGIRSRAPPLRA